MIFHYIFEPTCVYAQWAHMHSFLSVCLSGRLSVTGPKVTRPKIISQQLFKSHVGQGQMRKDVIKCHEISCNLTWVTFHDMS